MNRKIETSDNLKDLVRDKYAQIARQGDEGILPGCCGSGECCTTDAIMADSYDKLNGYVPVANLGLGCGLPTEFAKIEPGNTVVDLGSGAGNDAFVARAQVGEDGKVIGVDFTDEMIERARLNASKLGFRNVEFRLGDIENLPLAADTADVVVSNCVLNLVPNKQKAFQEAFRIMKVGGHFSVSDIVLDGALPDALKKAAEMYVGCVSGAVQKEEYLEIVRNAGFVNVTLQKEKEIALPDDMLKSYLSNEEASLFKTRARILSITLYGEKPLENGGCCSTSCCK